MVYIILMCDIYLDGNFYPLGKGICIQYIIKDKVVIFVHRLLSNEHITQKENIWIYIVFYEKVNIDGDAQFYFDKVGDSDLWL